MFNRSEILKSAHAYASTFAGRDWSYRQLLTWGMQNAWAEAKDGRTPAQRRVDAVKSEIAMLSYKSARIDIVSHRRRLEAELHALAA